MARGWASPSSCSSGPSGSAGAASIPGPMNPEELLLVGVSPTEMSKVIMQLGSQIINQIDLQRVPRGKQTKIIVILKVIL